ncbi:MAG: hypothetical protein KA472_11220 [Pseudomonadales bacterium]|nr:hypothetical protein [Pseudomonadales bacterium]
MPPKDPKVGDTWLNVTNLSWEAINPGEVAVWTGEQWAPLFDKNDEDHDINRQAMTDFNAVR